MKKKTQKPQPKSRNTLNKRLAKLATPQERLKALLDEREPKKHIRRDARLFVGKWQGVLALIRLDEKLGQESAEVESAISELRDASLDAIVTAFEKWDAGFFEDVAHEMRHAASVGPYDKRRMFAELSIITGEKASSVAKRLTAATPAAFESEKRQILRIRQMCRGDK